jgi:hypothetical protein
VLAHVDLNLPLKMHILVAQGETTFDIFCFFLAAKYCDYAEGGWDFKA